MRVTQIHKYQTMIVPSANALHTVQVLAMVEYPLQEKCLRFAIHTSLLDGKISLSEYASGRLVKDLKGRLSDFGSLVEECMGLLEQLTSRGTETELITKLSSYAPLNDGSHEADHLPSQTIEHSAEVH